MRSRLITVVLSATVMLAVAFLVPLLFLVRDLAADRELTAAERDASAVARLVAVVGSDDIGRLTGPVLSDGGTFNGRPISVVLPDGVVFGTALDGDEDISLAASGRSLRQSVAGGEAVYVPVIVAGGDTVVVRALADGEAMREGVVRVSATLIAVAVVLVVLAVALADRLGRSLVRPVNELAAATDRLGTGDLATRVDPTGPAEVRRVGVAFNRLATQVSSLLQRERETAADLSHRLRTPLTAARLNADALPEGDRKERLLGQLGEIERVVDHVIGEIRRPDRQSAGDRVDIRPVVEERVAFWEPLAADEKRTLTADVVADATVELPRADLVAALDALIGNVFAHTPAGVGMTLVVRRLGDAHIDIIVEDEGDGFPSDLDVRDRGSSGADSTGLGLDIAARTAEAAGGELMLGTGDSGGACITLRLARVR